MCASAARARGEWAIEQRQKVSENCVGWHPIYGASSHRPGLLTQTIISKERRRDLEDLAQRPGGTLAKLIVGRQCYIRPYGFLLFGLGIARVQPPVPVVEVIVFVSIYSVYRLQNRWAGEKRGGRNER